MAEEPGELREQIADRRYSIAGTVDQIENRVSPSRIASRRTTRLRRRLTDLADSVFGNDDTDYRSPRNRPAGDSRYRMSGQAGATGVGATYADGTYAANAPTDNDWDDSSSNQSVMERAQAVAPGPEDVRRQTRGNPLAAGLISLGAGLLLGSVLPDSERERELAERAQPRLRDAAGEAAAVGQQVAQDLREPAERAAADLKGTASDHAKQIKSEATDAAVDVKDTAKS